MPWGRQHDFDFTAEQLLLEQGVFTDIGGDDLADLFFFEQYTQAKAIDAAVVGDHREVAGAFALDFGDEVFRDAAQAKAAGEYGHAVFQACQRFFIGRHAFIETCHMHLFYCLWSSQ